MKCKTHISRDLRRCSGQACIELAMAIVLLLLIVTGLLHVNRMARTSLFLHSVLRGEAGTDAMHDGALAAGADYISDWDAGADGLRYTADDRPVRDSGNLSATILSLTSHSVASADDWQHVAANTRLRSSMIRLHATPMMSTAIEMTHQKQRLYVPVESVIRQLVYDKQEIPIEEEVWMPLMGGMY